MVWYYTLKSLPAGVMGVLELTYVFCECRIDGVVASAATYVCNTRSCNTVWMLLMMNKNIARNM